MAELIANIRGCIYSERVTVNTPARLTAAKKAIAKAIDLQLEGRGLSFVEVLSPCPTGWGLKPTDALDFIDSDMLPIYPLGVIKEAEHE
jgi:2-oxoglutarate ferredoxin oxidoreductase subunit beta